MGQPPEILGGGEKVKMEETIPYRPTFPVDEISQALYQYNKKKREIPKDNYQSLENKAYGLDSLLKADEKVIEEEIESIDFQIAERERIKQRNVIIRFLFRRIVFVSYRPNMYWQEEIIKNVSESLKKTVSLYSNSNY